MAIVLDAGSVSRGSGALGSNRERDIRNHKVRLRFTDAAQRIGDVAGLAADVEIGFELDELAQDLAKHGVVIDQ